MPGAVSRWNADKDLSFVPLRPELVVEIDYDQLEGDRLRHTGAVPPVAPRPGPASCTYDQFERPVTLRPRRGAGDRATAPRSGGWSAGPAIGLIGS